MKYILPSRHVEKIQEIDPYRNHPARRQHHVTPIVAPLYCVTVVFNPPRFYTRYKLYEAFEQMVDNAGGILYTVELALRDRAFEVTSPDNPRHIQLRTTSEVWAKELLCNVGISRLPADWEYVCVLDSDILFTNPAWVNECLHQLQSYKIVQMFSHATDLNVDFQPINTQTGFVYDWMNGHTHPTRINSLPKQQTEKEKEKGHWNYPYGNGAAMHSGYSWAYRRSALTDLGGLGDIAILGCYDDKTEVYTKRGFIPFNDLTMQDEVLSLSSKKVVEWGPVTKLHKYDYDGEMYKIKSEAVDLVVTPNHKMVFEKRDDRYSNAGELYLEEIQNISKADHYIPKQQTWVGELPAELPFGVSDWESWAAFMGIWLAEGSVYMALDANGKNPHYRINIFQNQGEKYDKINNLLLKAFPAIHFYNGDKVLTGNHKDLCKYLNKIGKIKTKFIPEEIKNLPAKYLSIFLDWFILGDGTIEKARNENSTESKMLYTSSPQLRDDLIEVIIKSGAWAGYYADGPRSSVPLKDGRVITSKVPNYRIWIQRAKSFNIKNRHISKEQYKGFVYCCETPHHTLLVRRNNKLVWCGNSSDHHMALSYIGMVQESIHGGMHQSFKDYWNEWQARATRSIKQNIGYMPGLILHYFHGAKKTRDYNNRWKILVDEQFNYLLDLKKDVQGMYMLTDRNIKLRDKIRKYFLSRDEDAIS